MADDQARVRHFATRVSSAGTAPLGFATIPLMEEATREAAHRRLHTFTKPQGALGRLEPPWIAP
jgi:hypothetical protein